MKPPLERDRRKNETTAYERDRKRRLMQAKEENEITANKERPNAEQAATNKTNSKA